MIVLEQRHKGGAHEQVFLVKRDGVDIGMITKYKNTRTEIHPWKAFLGLGMYQQYLGAFYDTKERVRMRDIEDVQFGGRAAAVSAITGEVL